MYDEEQMSFSDIAEERILSEKIDDIITEICILQNVDRKYITRTETQKGISVWICEPINMKSTVRVFNVERKDTKKIQRYNVSVMSKRINNVPIPDDASVVETKDAHQSVVQFPLDTHNLKHYLRDMLNYELQRFEPSEKFGCCGLYQNCSDAKKCLHRENFYAKACYYRKNLDSGNIFYGKNRNVD